MVPPNLDPEFLRVSLSTGKNLPYDAGKYVMCLNIKNMRYFLVDMKARLPTAPNAKPFPMRVGFCVPDVCDDDGVIDLVHNKSLVKNLVPELYFIQVQNVSATSPQLDLKNEAAAGIIIAIFMSFLIGLVLLSTVVIMMTEAGETGSQMSSVNNVSVSTQNVMSSGSTSTQNVIPEDQGLNPPGSPFVETRQRSGTVRRLASMQVIKAFSLVGKTGTLTKLIEIPPYKPTDSLNGVRVLNMFWIILGHTFLMPEGVSGYMNNEDITVNPLNTDVAERNLLFQLVVGSQNGVDTFFFLSGFLLAFLTLKELRAGRNHPFLAIALRYVRLTPSLALVMAVFYKIWVFFGHGPFAVKFQHGINDRCAKSWWSELSYTMNFIPFDSNKVCLGWSWYLGDDMIFFIIAIFLLPVYNRSRLMGWLVSLLVIAMSFGITSYLIVRHDLGVYVFDEHYDRYSYWAYSKPYSRIPAYFIGMMGAWLLDEAEQRGFTRESRPNTPEARRYASLIMACTLGVMLFLLLIPFTNFGDNANAWSTFTNVVYINLARPAFAGCWCVITVLCYYDYCPLVNAILSNFMWTPMARLTYGAYLVHPLVIKLAAGRAYQFYTFSGMEIAYRFCGNVILAHLGSVGLWVLCERPCMTIFSPSKKRPSAKVPREVSMQGEEGGERHSNLLPVHGRRDQSS
jgi:peptidoglycan/LPS O-acetylase OafA/YrhL